MRNDVDPLDLKILLLAVEQPRAGVREYSRRLPVARGTVQARLEKLRRLGVLSGWGPTIDTVALGYATKAYVRLSLSQGVLEEVTARLRRIPEVIEADSTAGDSDMLCVVVARGPENLEEVVQRILTVPGVQRTRSETVLRQRIFRRVHPLLEGLQRESAGTGTASPQAVVENADLD
ncbi:Lrp/AsnC family transcriptional regulator [Amycolatopsis pithecellobii]|uniref:Winged helix-turn-helix transcriptional regulator n=1 Tax=Amycolatopsis pithecellobii TaxID=664692 RepID=A0A6N7YR57_9PSEU|nr:Lrp/AsnC family transcriptional regulator [Amycolatopsis pithecellobii]MTD55505.1 winged helix-turn-helix transcriptional regulator [Amycolatopsis pithecellobii]